MQSSLQLLALMLVLAALFGYLNNRLLHLPLTVGILVCALGATLLLIALDQAWPELDLKLRLKTLLENVDFSTTLLNGVLAFLLFAGALEVDLSEVLERKWTILALATLGTVLSTGMVAGALFALSMVVGLNIPFIWCLVFGALISPTDPVAVLAALKRAGIPRPLQATIAGESLFNDGIGIVLFTLMLSLATGTEASSASVPIVAWDFLYEAVGGGLMGLALGYVAFLAFRQIDDHSVELIVSLALVTGTYSIAGLIGVSGPVAVAVAGILVGNQGMRLAMSERTREHLKAFWTMIDDTLNALLFLLIGLEIAAVELDGRNLAAMAVMIPVTLLVRWFSVAASSLPLNLRVPHRFGSLIVLTWGGLRGGLSVAMALALPSTEWKSSILTVAYGIVVFSIVVQGLTLEGAARRSLMPQAAPIPWRNPEP
jgi:CPA1 family monovalent cation:H+ antiporter